MIIDITITNFRSIKRKQTFSLFAENSSKHLINNIAYPLNDKFGVFRSAAIYGANASGKTNILKAFEAIRYIVSASGDFKDGDAIPCYEPFLLSNKTKKAPTSFEIEFIENKIRYIYKVKYDDKRILSESLDYYPSRVKANLFNREKNDSWENVKFGSHYKGGKKKYAFFPNNSYLSKAGNSADSPKIIRTIFNYFRHGVFYLEADERVGTSSWKENPELITKIGNILSKVDTGISRLSIKEQDISEIEVPNFFPKSLKEKILESEQKIPVFHHTSDDGFEEFTQNMESAGTMKLFSMMPLLIAAFKHGGVLLLDELDNSFHPHIAELIIKLFNNPNVNKNNAQLIFSTHNINLMSPSILRRDQVWLTEKNNGETIITSLEDFDKNVVKIDSPFNRWYDEGRFGAIPKIDINMIAEIISKG